MNRKSCLLGDFLTLKRGHDLPSQMRQEGCIPVVSSAGITGYHSEAKAFAPGVVTGRYGTLGEVFFLEEDYWPLNTALYVVDFKGNDPRFTAYFLRNLLKNYQSDKAAIPGVDRNVLHALEVKIPSVDIQVQISQALSNYDDLIANNRRRIEILTRTASLLYREWFVHLRFPGHQLTKITDGVPDGWGKRSLTELADTVSYGFTASSTTEPVGPKFLRITDIVPSSISWINVPFCLASEKEISKYRLNPEDIVVARTGATVGYAKQIHYCEVDTVFASYLVRFKFSNSIDPLIPGTYMQSDEYKNHVRANAGGAAQPNANALILGGAKILVPPTSIQRAFREWVTPINNQIAALEKSIERLSNARDLLLPRLINGELAV